MRLFLLHISEVLRKQGLVFVPSDVVPTAQPILFSNKLAAQGCGASPGQLCAAQTSACVLSVPVCLAPLGGRRAREPLRALHNSTWYGSTAMLPPLHQPLLGQQMSRAAAACDDGADEGLLRSHRERKNMPLCLLPLYLHPRPWSPLQQVRPPMPPLQLEVALLVLSPSL